MSAPDTDARRNLSDALLCAERGRAGVWVCFCGRVIAGNAARKVHTRDFDAFRGFTEDDEHRVEESSPPKRLKTAELFSTTALTRARRC